MRADKWPCTTELHLNYRQKVAFRHNKILLPLLIFKYLFKKLKKKKKKDVHFCNFFLLYRHFNPPIPISSCLVQSRDSTYFIIILTKTSEKHTVVKLTVSTKNTLQIPRSKTKRMLEIFFLSNLESFDITTYQPALLGPSLNSCRMGQNVVVPCLM